MKKRRAVVRGLPPHNPSERPLRSLTALDARHSSPNRLAQPGDAPAHRSDLEWVHRLDRQCGQ